MNRPFRTLAAGLAVIVLLGGCTAGSGAPAWTFAPEGAPAATDNAAPAASHDAGHGSEAPVGTIRIEAFDLGFTPAEVEVDGPGTYDVEFANVGVTPHDVTFEDGTTIAALGGETASGTVTVPEGGLTFICSVPGHEAGGMTGAVTVKGSAPAPGGDDHGGPMPEGEVAADPNAAPYELFDARAPARLEGEVHDIELVMTEEEMTVAEGFVQKVWTFGGTVPGPVIRVKVGDTIRITLKNPAENELGHSIDFHSSQVAWNDEMTTIAPGEEKVYEWKAEYAGVWMYHCGTSPALHHIANGMYGMVIVEPEEGLAPVDNEVAVLQSEWYLGEQGQPADLNKAMAAAPAPDFVLFNGVANQYVDNPLEVPTGETVRVFVLNAGPSVDSSFHVVGTIFNTVIKEGIALTNGNPGNWGSQAVDLAPAQGAIVEFTMPEDGMYPMVTHAFNFVGRGALGLFQAGDGDPLN
jgi:nitrite reductase (NO-forming)